MPRILCMQKQCLYCKRPQFDDDGKFLCGTCVPRNNTLILESNDNYEIIPNLECWTFKLRDRKVKY